MKTRFLHWVLLFGILLLVSPKKGLSQNNHTLTDPTDSAKAITFLHGSWGVHIYINRSFGDVKRIDLLSVGGNKGFHEMIFNPDQSFRRFHYEYCGGSTVFIPDVNGKFEMVDSNYIQLSEKVYDRDTAGKVTEELKNIGSFYITPIKDGYRLLKSSGSLAKDKEQLKYLNMLIEKEREMQTYKYYFKDAMDITTSSLDTAIALCLAKYNIYDFEVLYTNDYIDYSFSFVKIGTLYRCLFLGYDKNANLASPVKIYKSVKLFNETYFKDIDDCVEQKDAQKMDTLYFRATNNLGNDKLDEEILMLGFGRKIEKIIYLDYQFDGTLIKRLTFYFDQQDLFYTKVEYNLFNQTDLTHLDIYYGKDMDKIIKKRIEGDENYDHFPFGEYFKITKEIESIELNK